MDAETKAVYLKANNWFCFNGHWHHPRLPNKLDLDSAYNYQLFKGEVDQPAQQAVEERP